MKVIIFLDTPITNRLSEATGSGLWPQAEAWGFIIITALRAEERVLDAIYAQAEDRNSSELRKESAWKEQKLLAETASQCTN